MNYFTWFISSINLYMGLRYFLNAIHVLHTSKYSQRATVLFAILFTGMGVGGLYFSLVEKNNTVSLLLGMGPWILALLILLFNMLTSDYK
jgi:hypothetical protein